MTAIIIIPNISLQANSVVEAVLQHDHTGCVLAA